MKKKLLSHILMVATILTSYTVGTMQPTQTVNASTPKQISVTNAIPICDIAGYFYDKYGYLCFELGDTTNCCVVFNLVRIVIYFTKGGMDLVKGYTVPDGFMGLVEDKYQLFETECAYYVNRLYT